MTADRPRVLAVLPGFIPSTMITVVKPLVSLHRKGRVTARIKLESQAGLSDIRWADALVFCRNTDPRFAPRLNAALELGKPLLYDLDDNLLDLPPDCEGLSGLREDSRQAMLHEYLRVASLVRVYSPILAARVTALCRRVVTCFAPVDLSLTAVAPPTAANGPVKIVYATSRTQDSLCGIFLEPLERILRRYAGRVEFHAWGCRLPSLASLRNVRHHGLVYQYDNYLRRFARGGYDIGLAPLPQEAFYRAKTNNKFREYGACRIAGIYSDVEVYSNCVRDGESGLLVGNDPERWHEAMTRLIEDSALRERIGRQAHRYVREHYSQEAFEERFCEQIDSVLHDRQPVVEAISRPSVAAIPAQAGAVGRWLDRARRMAARLGRFGIGPTWTALRWYVSDRVLAARLRWQLSRESRSDGVERGAVREGRVFRSWHLAKAQSRKGAREM